MEVPTGKPMLFYAKQFDTAHTKSIQKACSPSRIRSLFENQELFLVWNVVIKPNLNQLQYHHKCVKPIPKLNGFIIANSCTSRGATSVEPVARAWFKGKSAGIPISSWENFKTRVSD